VFKRWPLAWTFSVIVSQHPDVWTSWRVRRAVDVVASAGPMTSAPLPARLDAATRGIEGGEIGDDARAALQSALDRIERYAVAVALALGRPIPERPSPTEG
jgi:hypothetical protein